MPVNNYLKDCKYSLNNLDNYIYLYQFNEPILNFITDDGESNATATSIKGSSQRLYCNSVQYQSTTSIDNRFAFDNTLTVTLSEHSKVSHYSIIQTLLNGNWMVVFKNTDGDAFVVNAEYPVMVSYSYVINDEKTPNNLTITFRALQNVPTVNLKGSVAFSSTLCDNYCEYNISRIESLKMIDMNKATIDVDNDGFSLTEIGEGNLKTIEFNPTSMSFTDSFDGREFSQTLTFQIPFDSYRYYFHYNLLEFLDNRYYALIKTTDDNNILGGFRQGLFPSYTISTADNNNVITITLTAKYTNYSVLGSDTMSTTTNDGMFYKPVMGECVDKLYVWTLIEQYNANGVATNGYYCLSGFEDIYNDYTILGTYDKYDTRFGFKLIDYNIDCSEGCKINNLPSSIQFENSGETKCYTLDTTCSIVWEWNSTAIDFTYDEITKEMCVTSKVDEGTFNIKATTTDGTIQYATVVIGNGGITGDTTTTINITAEGQRVTVIPVKGMSNVKSLTSSLQYQVNQNGNGYEVTVPENTREETKTYTITILYKDNSIETVSIIQERIYYIITSSEETECYGQNLYYVDKKYKKYTENGELIFVENIKGNQKETDSVICLDFDEKVSGCTNCFEGFVYTLYEYKKNGSTIATRYEKTTSSCTNNASTEYVVNTEKAKCVDGTEYYVEEMYGTNCNGGNNVKLYPVIERTSIVEATDSNVCDVIDPNASGGTLYRWVDTNETYCLTNTAQTNCTSSTTNTYCDGYNLFEQTTYYVDALCNGNWVQSGNTQTILKEANSTRCGYVEPEEPDTPTGDTTECSDVLSFEYDMNEMDDLQYSINWGTDYDTTYEATKSPYTTTFNGNLISTAYMFEACEHLTKVTSIPCTDNVTNMEWMFSECYMLPSLDLSYFDTSKVTAMGSMFNRCYSLSSLNISSFDTSNVTDISRMFNRCSGLTTLDLSNFNTSKVTSMEGIFSQCENLTSLDVSSWDVSKVTQYDDMFYYCTSLQTLRVKEGTYNWWCARLEEAELSCNIIVGDEPDTPTGDTSNYLLSFEFTGSTQYLKTGSTDGSEGVLEASTSPFSTIVNQNQSYISFANTTVTNIISLPKINYQGVSQMFAGCNSLTSLDLENLSFTSTYLQQMFYGCTNLSSINVKGWDTSNVINMREVFCNCSALRELDLSDWTGESLLVTSGMFSGCTNLATIDVSNLDVNQITNTTYYANMFKGCYSLQTLRIKEGTYEWWCNRLQEASIYCDVIVGDEPDTPTGDTTSDTLSFEFSGDTTTYKLNNTTYTATSSPYSTTLDDLGIETLTSCTNTFSGSSITELTSFPDTSNATSMSKMFYNCYSLTTLDVSNFDTSNVTDMSKMFYNCRILTSLDLSNFNTTNVTSMSDMFIFCSGLTELNVSNFNTSNVTDMSYMFNDCKSLTTLNVSNFNTSNVTDMNWMFKNCSGLTELNVSNFNTSNATSMSNMFTNCKSLTSLDVSNFNTSNVTDMEFMFSNCESLTSLDVSNFNTSNVTDMRVMFQFCSSLTELDLSNFDTSKVTDMSTMFNGCKSLQYLDVSSFDISKVTTYDNMFRYCTKLQTLKVKQGTRAWWCDRLQEAGLSCDIIEEDRGNAGGGIVDAE